MPTFECLTCRATTTYVEVSEVPYRPFCSKRCEMIDLGKWLNEDFCVSEELPVDPFADDESDRFFSETTPEE